MKFRFKITLCMICLLSFLIGIGGGALINVSFQTSLNQEKETALKSYQLMLGALQIVNGTNTQADSVTIPKTLKQMTSQGLFSWAGLNLSSETETLYEQGSVTTYFSDVSGRLTGDHCLVTNFKDAQNKRYLQLSGQTSAGADKLYLTVAYDISSIYITRARNLATYYRIFFVMILLCAVLAYSMSYMLTRPLSVLSKASKEIASGNLSFRSEIFTNDEVGSLSSDFDAMAEQVEQSVHNLKDAMERQDRFIGSFAHEMKTPMTSIIGYADLLRGQTLSAEEQAEAANYIFSEGKRLESLSFKLLDLFVTGKKNLVKASLSPAKIVRETVASLKPIYQKEGVALNCSCQEGTCLLEPDLFSSLLLNLLDNAKKAMEGEGSIRIEVAMLSNGCRIAVADNGKGIPPEALAHITEAFYRVDKCRCRKQGGVGLGLALCAKIAELHGGTIRFASKPGEGTTVTVELKGGRSS